MPRPTALDGSGFAARCEDDRHHFPASSSSPEDAAELEDLRGFTRDLAVAGWRSISARRLDWVARGSLEHGPTRMWHLIVRGVDECVGGESYHRARL